MEASDHAWELIVRWLPLQDVLSLSETCKRLHTVCWRAPLPLLDDAYTSRAAPCFSAHNRGLPRCRSLEAAFRAAAQPQPQQPPVLSGRGGGSFVCGTALQLVRWVCSAGKADDAAALAAMWAAFVRGAELADAVAAAWHSSAPSSAARANAEALVAALLLPRENVAVRALSEDAEAMERIAVFAEYCVSRHGSPEALQRIRLAARLSCTAQRPTVSSGGECAEESATSVGDAARMLDWWERYEPKVVAQALTAFEQRLLFRVAPRELIGAKWRSLRAKQTAAAAAAANAATPPAANATALSQAPNTSLLLRRFNALAQVLASWILSKADLRERAAAIERAVAVATELRRLNNFQQMAGVVCGLSCASITRLAATWEAVSADSRARCEELRALCVVDEEYRGLRDAARAVVNEPCLPYLGVLFLTLAHLRNTRVPSEPGKLLMFSKWKQCYAVVAELFPFLSKPYSFEIELDEDAKDALNELSRIPEDHATLFAQSLVREPRVAAQAPPLV